MSLYIPDIITVEQNGLGLTFPQQSYAKTWDYMRNMKVHDPRAYRNKMLRVYRHRLSELERFVAKRIEYIQTIHEVL